MPQTLHRHGRAQQGLAVLWQPQEGHSPLAPPPVLESSWGTGGHCKITHQLTTLIKGVFPGGTGPDHSLRVLQEPPVAAKGPLERSRGLELIPQIKQGRVLLG